MAFVVETVLRIMRKPTLWDAFSDLLLLALPLWAAALVGLLLGWAWRPRWAVGLAAGEGADVASSERAASRVVGSGFWLPWLDFLRSRDDMGSDSARADESREIGDMHMLRIAMDIGSDVAASVGKEDLAHLWRLVEECDGGPSWQPMMDRTLPSMRYSAWRRDPENGPPQYRSSTIFEDATAEEVRDFFWDDEFRMSNKWDNMLVYHNTLEECPTTGTMIVHWIRKFPLFCSDREYIIGRRIWKAGKVYYCVTKGVPGASVPRQNKPRRVDLYYSSWCIRPVESRSGDGKVTACEVLLFHHEDMGIPWEIAKLGVRQGMWGCVKRIEPGLRAYQAAKISLDRTSRSALMAHINTKVGCDFFSSLRSDDDDARMEAADVEKPLGRNIQRLLLLGGAVALACTFDQGLVTKAVIFGVARRFLRQRKSM